MATVVKVNESSTPGKVTLVEQVASTRRALMRRLSRQLASLNERPIQQLRVLNAIGRGEVQSQSKLADRLLIDPPAVSRILDRLEADGLLTRCAGADRRCVRLELTAAGQKEHRRFRQSLDAIDAELEEHLSAAEIETLKALLAAGAGGVRGLRRPASRAGRGRSEEFGARGPERSSASAPLRALEVRKFEGLGREIARHAACSCGRPSMRLGGSGTETSIAGPGGHAAGRGGTGQ